VYDYFARVRFNQEKQRYTVWFYRDFTFVTFDYFDTAGLMSQAVESWCRKGRMVVQDD
jgi:hypothetical protein